MGYQPEDMDECDLNDLVKTDDGFNLNVDALDDAGVFMIVRNELVEPVVDTTLTNGFQGACARLQNNGRFEKTVESGCGHYTFSELMHGVADHAGMSAVAQSSGVLIFQAKDHEDIDCFIETCPDDFAALVVDKQELQKLYEGYIRGEDNVFSAIKDVEDVPKQKAGVGEQGNILQRCDVPPVLH